MRAEQKKRKSSSSDEDSPTTIYILQRQLAQIMLQDAEQKWYSTNQELLQARQHYLLMRDQYNTIKQLLNNVDINSTKNANDPQLPTDIDDHDQNKNENNFLSDNTLHLDYFYHC